MERSHTESQAPQSGGEQDAPVEQQRDGLRGLLRSLDFAQGAQALKPPTEGGGGAAPEPVAPTLEPGKLKRMFALVPAALTEVGAPEAAKEAPVRGEPAAEKQGDPVEKEAEEAAQAESAVPEEEARDEVEAAPAEAEEAEEEAEEAEEVEEVGEVGEVEAEGEPVQLKAKPKAASAAKAAPAAKPAPAKAKPAPAAKAKAKAAPAAKAKAKAKAAAKGHAPAANKHAPTAKPRKAASKALKQSGKAAQAPEDKSLPLSLARVRAAYQWTKKHSFSGVPFIVRRYQVVLGEPATGIVNYGFCQAVARFQLAHGQKPVHGKLGGNTAKIMRHVLRTKYGLDKKGLLTRRELKMAQKKNVNAIHTHHLSWKTVSELRGLLGLPKAGGLNAAFLRAIAEFQVKHKLPRAGFVSGKTAKAIKSELGSANEAIYAAAKGYEGTSTAAGPGGGNVACAWAVNNILQRAIGHKIGSNTNLVSSVESGLAKEGFPVDKSQVKAGDIVIAPGDHIGIAMSSSRALSNSSSRASFVWWSDLEFDGYYGGGNHFWRVKKT